MPEHFDEVVDAIDTALEEMSRALDNVKEQTAAVRESRFEDGPSFIDTANANEGVWSISNSAGKWLKDELP